MYVCVQVSTGIGAGLLLKVFKYDHSVKTRLVSLVHVEAVCYLFICNALLPFDEAVLILYVFLLV